MTIVETNMSASMQIDAVDSLKTAYEKAATDQGKVDMFSQLFKENYATHDWDVLYDYADYSFTSEYRIILKIGIHYFVLFSTKV